jgi:DNA-directed RNA polymerase subunit L
MEVKILEESKNSIKVELIGENHTLASALGNELNNDSHVLVAGYTYEHPLVSNPILIIKTDGKISPIKAINSCIASLKKNNSEFLVKIKKL